MTICLLTRRSIVLPRSPARKLRRGIKKSALQTSARNDIHLAQVSSVVNNSWLSSKLGDTSTKVLDASWYLPNAGRNPVAEFKQGHIPTAQYFDVNGVCDRNVDLPHMLPSETAFAAAADSLGISPSDHVVVYDGMGLFSAARAWWTFKVFGHKQVSLLNGGLPGWKAAGLETESSPNASDSDVQKATEASIKAKEGETKYLAKLDKSQVRSIEEMLNLVKSREVQILDARPGPRFHGKAPEPRKGLKSGHMPGSLSLPHSVVLTPEGFLKSKEEIFKALSDAKVDLEKDTVCSCGSGVTACVLALMLNYIGFEKQVAVYDGSWSEWGSREDTPVVV